MINNNINLIEKSDIIVMQLEIPIEIVTFVAKLAKQKEKMVVLDPAPAKENLSQELFNNVDIIKPNEMEAQILSGIELKTEEDVMKAARKIIEKGVKTVIVTLGKNGSMLVTEVNYKKFQALDVKVIDTTAAGDSFTAALVKSLVDGKNIEEAIKYGHVVSSMVVTRKGTQTSIPSKEEVEIFLKKWKET